VSLELNIASLVDVSQEGQNISAHNILFILGLAICTSIRGKVGVIFGLIKIISHALFEASNFCDTLLQHTGRQLVHRHKKLSSHWMFFDGFEVIIFELHGSVGGETEGGTCHADHLTNLVVFSFEFFCNCLLDVLQELHFTSCAETFHGLL